MINFCLQLQKQEISKSNSSSPKLINMSKIFAVLLLAAVIAAASAQYVYNSGLAYTGYSPLAYSGVYSSGLGYAVPSYSGLGYGYGYASPYYGGLAYYKK